MSKDSDLAKQGSLSYRFNIGPLAKEKDVMHAESKDEEEIGIEEYVTMTDANKLIDIQNKLKKSEASKKAILDEYLKCERELRLKTEETVKLKTELKDLKEIIKLSGKLKEQNLEVSSNDDSSDLTGESLNFLKKRNGFRRNCPQFGSSPVKSSNKEKQFNCTECFF